MLNKIKERIKKEGYNGEALLERYKINEEIKELATLYNVKEDSIHDCIEIGVKESKYFKEIPYTYREALDDFKDSRVINVFIKKIKRTEAINKSMREQIDPLDIL